MGSPKAQVLSKALVSQPETGPGCKPVTWWGPWWPMYHLPSHLLTTSLPLWAPSQASLSLGYGSQKWTALAPSFLLVLSIYSAIHHISQGRVGHVAHSPIGPASTSVHTARPPHAMPTTLGMGSQVFVSTCAQVDSCHRLRP